jgi:uncharacterized ion transporter superfamily protein YfcC
VCRVSGEHHGQVQVSFRLHHSLFLIAVVAALSWVVPAGQYQMALNETLGKEVPIAGTYAHVAAHPQG